MSEGGRLYVVATPIGNLDDITLRALKILGGADRILAEDTRHTRKLLKHLNLDVPTGGIHSAHDHNEASRIGMLTRALGDGEVVALVSDAGTPAISDPGYRLVRAAWEAGFRVIPVPGVCAAIAALSAGGLPTDRFTFAGFPPKKGGARSRWLDELATAPGTLILYAPSRDVATVLEDVARVRSDPAVAVFREISKAYEECSRGTASEVAADWRAKPRKGEATLLIDRPAEAVWDDAGLLGLLRDNTVKEVQSITGVSRRRIYALSLALKAQTS